MPNPSKGLTESVLLRLTPQERQLAIKIQEAYAERDIKISQNDAFRKLIRDGATYQQERQEQEAALQERLRTLHKHRTTCATCADGFREDCADGWVLFNHGRGANGIEALLPSQQPARRAAKAAQTAATAEPAPVPTPRQSDAQTATQPTAGTPVEEPPKATEHHRRRRTVSGRSPLLPPAPGHA